MSAADRGSRVGIDLHALADQAETVLSTWRNGDRDVIDLIFAPASALPPAHIDKRRF
jgi:hypothetical protein